MNSLIQDARLKTPSKDPTSSTKTNHGSADGSSSDEEESDTNISYSSRSDHSSEGDASDTEENQSKTESVEGPPNIRNYVDSVDTNLDGKGNEKAPVQNLDEATDTEDDDGSSTGRIIIVEAESKSGVRGTDESSSRWDDHGGKEGKKPAEEESQDKPQPSPGEMQGKLVKSFHPQS